MAVVPRTRASGVTVFYVVNTWPQKPGKSKQQSENIGTSKRAAEIRDRAMKKEIADGTYQPPSTRTRPTLGAECHLFNSKRTNVYAPTERALFRRYIEPRPWLTEAALDDVKPASHIDRLVDELRAEKTGSGQRRLSDKTISNVLGYLGLVFKAAVRADRCLANPVVLAPRTLQRAPEVEKETYTGAELVVLTSHHTIPWPLRVLNGLCGFGGLRLGEAAGLRWRDLDGQASPLPGLVVDRQYGGQTTKTGRPRVVPVHPELVRILNAWATEGFELVVGRKPTPEDPIVPIVSSRSAVGHYSRSTYYKAFIRTAELAGVRPRSIHSLRHTMITLARRGGARKDVLEKVTHNARGDIVDRYTHLDWLPLCEAVLCLKLVMHPEPQRPLGSRGNPGSLSEASVDGNAQESPQLQEARQGSIPRASTRKQHKTSGFGEARQETRQVAEVIRAEISAANRKRKRALISLSEIDPEGAAPGLAVCRALDATLAGDVDKAERLITQEARRRG
jgi:integrase